MNYEYKYHKYKTKYLAKKLHQTGGVRKVECKRLTPAQRRSQLETPDYLIQYPFASDFLEWFNHHARKYHIPVRNLNTGGDFSRTIVASTPKIEMDWKHLDASEIEAFSDRIKKYGYRIQVDGQWYDYKVNWVKI